jgi:hypothetical protein
MDVTCAKVASLLSGLEIAQVGEPNDYHEVNDLRKSS